MSGRTLTLFVALGALWASVTPALGDAKMQTVTVKYVGHRSGRAWGRPCMLLVAAPPKGRQTTTLVVPNQDPAAYKYDPSPHVVKLVKRLQAGDLIEVRFGAFKGQNVLNRIKPVKVKADEPEYFTLVKVGAKKVGLQEHLYVIVQKGDEQAQLLVPNKRGADGKWVPDEKIAEQAKKFRQGDKVDVAVRKVGGTVYLNGIYAHTEPETAELVKRELKDVDGEKHLCVVLKQGETERVVPLPNVGKDGKGNPIPDRDLSAATARLRPRQKVDFKVYKDGDKTYLREIGIAKPRPKDRPEKK